MQHRKLGRFVASFKEGRISRRSLVNEFGKQGVKLLLASEASVGMVEIGIAGGQKYQENREKREAFLSVMNIFSQTSLEYEPQLQGPLKTMMNGCFDADLAEVIQKDYDLRETAFIAVYKRLKLLFVTEAMTSGSNRLFSISEADVEILSRISAYAESRIGKSNSLLAFVDGAFGIIDDPEISEVILERQDYNSGIVTYRPPQSSYNLFSRRLDYVSSQLLR